ncbi:V-set domain-containing T-cell activation inhibitor 1 [Etheostoma cragini]|uniref:V-set domain-containing T-cell activation inhibitor 1 n=1 Tax=Etheostoma cragini TaxID=417921 RepID=UPI00155EE73F|nr:V-set domain-containing T-cell activation inhibitor 1 [Etheostoma cragini]
MATFGQILFTSMITLIVIFSAIIILILALSLSGTLSEVISTNTMPVANLGEDQLLSCFLSTKSQPAGLTDVSVTWEKNGLTGFVNRYQNGALDLADQNSQFKGRTQLFLDALTTGNASLLLRGVTRSDEGEYTCSISSSGGGGKVNIYLRTAAFTAPTFKFTNGTLAAEATRWFPKPNVTWSNYDRLILPGNTSFTSNSAGIFSVVSTLQSINVSDTYTYRIENDLVTGISTVTVAGTDVSGNTYFTYSAASSLLTSTYLSMTTSVLYIYYVT